MAIYRPGTFVNDLLLDNLQRQRKSGQFCDVRLFIGKQQSLTHSAVICPVSLFLHDAYFKSAKRTKSKDKNIKNPHSLIMINLKGIVTFDCFACLEKLIDFIYGNTIRVDKDHISHLQSYCDNLNINEELSEMLHNKHCTNDASNEISFIKSEYSDNEESHSGSSDSYLSNFQNKNDLVSKTIDKSISEDNLNPDGLRLSNDSTECNFKSQYETTFLRLPTGKSQNCIGCKYKCYKSLDLLEHLLQTGHGGQMCSLCWTTVDNSSKLMDHILLHKHPKPYFCIYCNSRFQTRTLLAQHLPSHMNQRPYVCSYCQKTFKSKHSLNCHLIIHSNEKKHLCDECGFSTLHARMLRAHKLIHSGNLYKCSFPNCDHTSTIKQNMEQHFVTHSNKKPFVCELCGHKFSQSKSLKRHSLIHSKGEFGNICPHCPFKARRIDNLKAHIFRQHTAKKSKTDISYNCVEAITIQPAVSDILSLENCKQKKL